MPLHKDTDRSPGTHSPGRIALLQKRPGRPTAQGSIDQEQIALNGLAPMDLSLLDKSRWRKRVWHTICLKHISCSYYKGVWVLCHDHYLIIWIYVWSTMYQVDLICINQVLRSNVSGYLILAQSEIFKRKPLWWNTDVGCWTTENSR